MNPVAFETVWTITLLPYCLIVALRAINRKQITLLEILVFFWSAMIVTGFFVTLAFGGHRHFTNTSEKTLVYVSLHIFFSVLLVANQVIKNTQFGRNERLLVNMVHCALVEIRPIVIALLLLVVIISKIIAYLQNGSVLVRATGIEAVDQSYWVVVTLFIAGAFENLLIVYLFVLTLSRPNLIRSLISLIVLTYLMIAGSRGSILILFVLSLLIFTRGKWSKRSDVARVVKLAPAVVAVLLLIIFPSMLIFRNVVRSAVESEQQVKFSEVIREGFRATFESSDEDRKLETEHNLGEVGRLYFLNWNAAVFEYGKKNGYALGRVAMNDFTAILPRILKPSMFYESDFYIQLLLSMPSIFDAPTNLLASASADFGIAGALYAAVFAIVMIHAFIFFSLKGSKTSWIVACIGFLTLTRFCLSFESSPSSIFTDGRNAFILWLALFPFSFVIRSAGIRGLERSHRAMVLEDQRAEGISFAPAPQAIFGSSREMVANEKLR
jgi:hypothetical protein